MATHRQPFHYFLLFIAVMLLALPAQALAQGTSSANLRGTVADPTGAVIPGADVTASNQATQEQRHAITDGEGRFFFSALRPGDYTLTVEMPGFKVYEQTNIRLSPAETRGLNVQMELGAQTETLTVTSVMQAIKTETPSKEDTITAEQIDNLSIISRSSMELLRMLPGVVAPDQDALESIGFGAGANANTGYNVNGLRGEFNNVSIDGGQMIDIGSNNGTMLTANPDMVQEVTVQTSNYSAEHGKSGVQISAVTKAGSSEFHGTGYIYARDNAFAANDRSNNYAGIPRPESQYFYPGFTVGGPILIPGTDFNRDRDKAFFFVGFEVQQQTVDPGTTLGVVPTLGQRQGDFSELLANEGFNLSQPTTVNIPQGFEGAGSPAPNNDLSPYINPIGQTFMNFYPEPNLTTPTNRFNYAVRALEPLDRTQLIMRFDYNFTENTKLYVRLGRETEEQDFSRGLWWDSSRFELPSHVLGTNLGRSISGNLVNVLSPTLTNELVVSVGRLKLDNDYLDPGRVSLSNLGIDYEGMFDPSEIRNNYAPVAFYSWGAGQSHGELWNPGGLPLFAWNDSFSVNDNVNKVMDAHALKFGVFVEQANKIQNFDGSDEGAFALGADWTPGGTGNDYGDLLIGRPAQFDQNTSTPVGHFRFWNVEAYVQDNWKVRPGLTLELGLRVGYFPNNFERDGLDVNFSLADYNPNLGPFPAFDDPNGILLASRDEIPKGIIDNPRPKLMPRVGFAWDIKGDASFVLRAGGGIFYNRPQGNAQYWVLRQPPNRFNSSMDTWSGTGLGGGEGLTFNTLSEIDPFSRLGTISLVSHEFQDRMPIPRVASMSFSLASQMPFDQIFEVAYVGTQGRHLQTRRPINFIPAGTFLSGGVGDADFTNPVHRVALDSQARAQFLPIQAWGDINQIEYTATSSYHSLQATLRRQAGESLQYYATYTFSKALGTVATNENGDLIDPVNARGRSYGVLPYDRTHIFNLSYNYYIPSLARGNFRNGFTEALFDGWQMSGITTFQSGTPIRLSFSGALAGDGQERAWFGTDAFPASGNSAGGISPIYSCDPHVGGEDVGDALLDLNCLSVPSFGETGPHQPPFYMRTPSRWNFDVSFFKNFEFDEDKRLQFRAGFFNILNSAYPRLSDGDVRLDLDTDCNVRVSGVPNGAGGTSDNVCDPAGGFFFTDLTQAEFGRVISKHGKRIVELALKFYF